MKLLRMDAVKIQTGHKSHASIYTAIKDGLFTLQIPIGKRSVGWPENEVEALNQARIAGFSDEKIKKLVDKLHRERQGSQKGSFPPNKSRTFLYTPGIWYPIGSWIEHEDNNVPDIANFDPESFGQEGRSSAEIHANVRLAAAAPEMLAALIAFEEIGNTLAVRKQISDAIQNALGVAAK